MGAAWACAGKLGGCVEDMRKSWLSLLCPTSVLMYDTTADHEGGGLVFGVTPYGLLVLRVQTLKANGVSHWKVAPPSEALGGRSWYKPFARIRP